MNESALLELPGGWVWTGLEDVAYFQEGPGLLRKQFREAGIPFLNIRTFINGRINKSLCQFLDPNEVKLKYNHFLLDKGDIVVSSSGSLGKTAIIQKEDLPLMLNTSVIRFRTLSESILTNQMLYLFLKSKIFLLQIAKLKTGTAQSNFGPTHLRQFFIPLPPLLEQRRIVTKIEELFTRLDAGVSELKKTQAQLKRYRQSVLKAACEGKLVQTEAELAKAEGLEYEPADVLLARILKERREKWNGKGKYKEPGALDSSLLPALPEGWVWATTEQIASPELRSIQSGPFGSALHHSEFQDSGILAIGIDNVLNGKFSMGRQHRISPEKFEKLNKFKARPLDVLITVMATVGRCCVVPANLEHAIITKHVYRISTNHTLADPYYLMMNLWGGSKVRQQIFGQVQGQTRPGINGEILKNIAIPVPPLAEQRRIVAEVERRLSIADGVEITVGQSLEQAERLRQSILKKAFEGRLVAQDASDEPAGGAAGEDKSGEGARMGEIKRKR